VQSMASLGLARPPIVLPEHRLVFVGASCRHPSRDGPHPRAHLGTEIDPSTQTERKSPQFANFLPRVPADDPSRSNGPRASAVSRERPGDEATLVSRTDEERPEFATFRDPRMPSQVRIFTGVSASFERRDRTTENRGVPGSSPGLAILNPAFQREFLLFGWSGPSVHLGTRLGTEPTIRSHRVGARAHSRAGFRVLLEITTTRLRRVVLQIRQGSRGP
jgi:hypothetical protein